MQGRWVTHTDAQIIASSLSDARQFGLIFDRHFDGVYRYLACRVGTSLADDLAAETFSQAFAGRRRFDPGQESARPWLYGIATNLVRRHHRQEARQLRAYTRSRPASADFDLDAVVDRVDAAVAGERVGAALASLEARDRDVLLLFGGAQQSYQDIAVALSIPIGTVRSRLN